MHIPRLGHKPQTDRLTDLRTDTPPTVLSDAALAALRALHDDGHDVDAYRALDRWVIWCRPAHAWQEGRFSPAEWEAFYRQWLAAAHAVGRLDAAYWLFVCRMIGERQTNGQLVPQDEPREVEIITEPATAAEGKVSA